MRYEVLGPVRVVDADGARHMTAAKVEIVLAGLLARADHVVSADRLIAEIWGESAPRRAAAGLQVYVSHLRKFLHRPGHDTPVVTRPPGYLLRIDPDETDFRGFLALLECGRTAWRDGCFEEALDVLDRALALWRGPAVGGVQPGSLLRAFAHGLDEARGECVELRTECALALGRHREVVGTLYGLCAEHPLRERFYQQLMLALHRSGRRADALAVFRSARDVLNAELGLEPCRSLRDLQGAILADEVPPVLPSPPLAHADRALRGVA